MGLRSNDVEPPCQACNCVTASDQQQRPHVSEGAEHAPGAVRLGLPSHALARRVVVVRAPVLADAAAAGAVSVRCNHPVTEAATTGGYWPTAPP